MPRWKRFVDRCAQIHRLKEYVRYIWSRLAWENGDTRAYIAQLESMEPRLLLSATIGGKVFADVNQNDAFDTGEKILTNWTVYVDINQDDQLDSGDIVTQTDASGQYALQVDNPGSYSVRIIKPHSQWIAGAAGEDISVNVTGDSLSNDFAFYANVSANGATQTDEGAQFELTLDPGAHNITSWDVDWGDGNVTHNIIPQSDLTTVTHVYADGERTYAIQATATDNQSNSIVAGSPAIEPYSADNETYRLGYGLSSGDGNRQDVEEYADGVTLINSGDLDLGEHAVGLRFHDITIPQNAVITRAYIQFESSENTVEDDFTFLTIYGEDSNNPQQFNYYPDDTYNLSNRPRTMQSVTWLPPAWEQPGLADEAQRTPNLASILQEIIDRPGWGDDVVFIIEGFGHRSAKAYPQSSGTAAQLIYEWEIPAHGGGSHVVTVNNVAPQITVTGGPKAMATVPYTLHFSATDAGDDEIATWRIDWGDGHIDYFHADASEATHIYETPDTSFGIQVYLMDEDSAVIGHAVAPHSVNTIAPEARFVFDAPTTTNSAKFIQLSLTDRLFDGTTVNWTVDWGDGNIDQYVGNTEQIQVNHTYGIGRDAYIIKVKAEVDLIETAAAPLPEYSDYVMNQSPIAYWQLNESVLDDGVIDTAGNHHGVFHSVDADALGLVGIVAGGGANRAMVSHPGIIEVDHHTSLVGNTGSINFFFKDENTIHNHGLFTKESKDNSQWNLRIFTDPETGSSDDTGFVKVELVNDSNWLVLQSQRIHVEEWYHVSLNWDGSYATLYLNGFIQDSVIFSGDLSANTQQVVIGSRNRHSTSGTVDTPTAQFSGVIDDVVLYSSPLAVEDIKQHYHRALGHWHITVPGSESITLTEADELTITHTQRVSIPPQAGAIRVNFSNLIFDSSSDNPADINDAFEIAVLDPNTGKSVLPTISPSSDAVINFSESQAVYRAVGVALLDESENIVTSVEEAGSVIIDYSPLLNSSITEVDIVVRLVNNDSDNTSTVTIGQEVTSNPVAGDGKVDRDYWSWVDGDAVADLVNFFKYPHNPSGSDYLYSLQGVDWNNPFDPYTWINKYGQRIYGYIVAPEDGAYTFWLAGDDTAEFWLSTDDTPGNLVKIAELTSSTLIYEWDKYTSQKSNPVTLQAGESYYFEILHKEASGADHVAVAWSRPGESTAAPSEVVPGHAISTFAVTGGGSTGGTSTFSIVDYPAGVVEYLWPEVNNTDKPMPAFSTLSDVTASFDMQYAVTSFDTADNQLLASVNLTKTSQLKVRGDLLLVVRGIIDQDTGLSVSAQLAQYDGLLPFRVDGVEAATPYLNLTSLASRDGEDFILTSDMIENVLLKFENIESDRFDFDLVLLGRTNAVPHFTTNPTDGFQGQAFPTADEAASTAMRLEIERGNGNTFNYTPDGIDPDEDDIAITLLGGPAGMNLSDGMLSWTPDAQDPDALGSHQVRLRITDTYGAFDPANDQIFTITVVDDATNRPPMIVSDPQTVGYAGQEYQYQVEAVDPDGDAPLQYSMQVHGLTIGESGKVIVEQADGNTWHTVTLQREYLNPVVVMGPPSYNGNDPSVVRVRNVTANSFEFQLDEWDYLDAAHTSETIGYLVVEAGTHILNDGTKLVAGQKQVDETFTGVSLGEAFSAAPVVLAQVASINEASAVTTRLQNVSGAGFEVRLQEEEDADGTHAAETVNWIAIEVGTGIVGDGTVSPIRFQAAVTPDAVTHVNYNVELDPNFEQIPVVLGNLQTYNGTDPIASRLVDVEAAGATVTLTGNIWKKIDLPYTVTTDTVLEFDFKSTVQGEIQAIGLDENDVVDATRYFQLYGTQTSVEYLDYRNYSSKAGQWVHYEIPVGQFYTGQMEYLFFVNDKDAGALNNNSMYRNVTLRQADGTIAYVNFEDYTFTSYPSNQNQDIDGSVSVSNSNQFTVFGEEEKSFDTEIDHVSEVFGFLAIDEGLLQLRTEPVIDSSGLITWTPTANDVGKTLGFAVTVSDQQVPEGIDTQVYEIKIQGPQADYVPADMDLVASHVNVSGLSTDRQQLTVQGVVSVDITNESSSHLQQGFDVVFFEDLNLDGIYTENVDQLLGTTRVEHSFDAYQTRTVSTVVLGQTQFAGAPIWAFIDSGNEIAEADELNNYAGSNEECRIIIPGNFDLSIKWAASDVFGEYAWINNLATPLVADLINDGTPEIIFTTTSDMLFEGGTLYVVDGNTGELIWDFYNDGTSIPYFHSGSANAAVGDIDNDGMLEIFMVNHGNGVTALKHDGTVMWASEPSSRTDYLSIISLADLEGDGFVEIVVGDAVWSHDGSLLWEGSDGRGANYWPTRTSIVADLDMDGVQEIIAGNTAYRADGTVYWISDDAEDGYVSIGNFDSDDYPEIVIVYDGKINLLEHTGVAKWSEPVYLPMGGPGGAPVVADIDNDGKLEIGVANRYRYSVFEDDGTLKWSSVIDDDSSGFTGATLFDFNGDSILEVVYSDERHLWIFDGLDGTPLQSYLVGSGTAFEYPIIADVDADGRAEIIVAANEFVDYPYDGPTGVVVFENETWGPSRSIWNQHSYHITNINDDGTIPRHENYSWLNNNSYRVNTIPGLDPTSAPDLIPSYVRVNQNAQTTTYTVRIGNGGSFFAPANINVAFYDADPGQGGNLLGISTTSRALQPGEYEDITFTINGPAVSDIWIVADDDGTDPEGIPNGKVTECNENNNLYNPELGYVLPPVNNQPYFTEFPATVAITGKEYSSTVSAMDADASQVLTYDLPVAPGGMVIDSVTGEITWTPGFAEARTHTAVVRVRDGRGGEAKHAFHIEVIDDNQSPTITSIPYGPAKVDSAYEYQVIAVDPNGDSLFYDVDPLSASRGVAVDQSGLLTWNTPLVEGDYEIAVRVRDGRGGSYVQTFVLPVRSLNAGPQIVSQAEGYVYKGDEWSYQVVAQDLEDGSSLTSPGNFTFTLDDKALSLGFAIDSNGLVTWTPAQIGTYNITISVADSAGAIATQGLTLPVNAKPVQNVLPEFVTTPEGPAEIDRPWQYLIRLKDANNDPNLTLTMPESPSWLSLSPGTQANTWLLSGTPTEAGTFKIVLEADDDGGIDEHVSTRTFWLPVLDNAAPIIVRAIAQTSGELNAEKTFGIEVIDPNQDDLTFELIPTSKGSGYFDPASVTGASNNPALPTVVNLKYTPAELGEQQITIRVTDSRGAITTHTIDLYAYDDGIAQEPPTVTLTAREVISANETFVAQVEASDPNGDELYYDLVFDNPLLAPTGMMIDHQTGRITWTPTADQITPFGGDPYEYMVTVTDGVTGLVTIVDVPLYVVARYTNHAPEIISSPVGIRATGGHPFIYDAMAIDTDNDPLQWSLIEGPATAKIDAVTGRFVWTPAESEFGREQTAVIMVSDPYGGRQQESFILYAQPGNTPPRITSVPATTIAESEPFVYIVRATDADGQPVTFSLEGDTTGLVLTPIDESSAEIRWDNPNLGTKEFSVIATDPQGAMDGQVIQITIVELMDYYPQFISQPTLAIQAGNTYQYVALAEDPDGPVTYSLVTAPASLLASGIDANTGEINWETTTNDIGVHEISIKATQNGQSAQQRFHLAVNETVTNNPPTISPNNNLNATEGQQFVFNVKASDPDGDALIYQLIDANGNGVSMLDGMAINANGRVLWTAGDSQRNFTVRVTDIYAATAEQSFTVNIVADQPPVVSLDAGMQYPKPGKDIYFAASASDDLGVTDLQVIITELWAGGQVRTLNVNSSGLAQYRIPAGVVGESFTVIATAVDTSGQSASTAPLTMHIPPVDVYAPVIQVASPYPGSRITETTEIVGKLYDPDNQLIRFTAKAVSRSGGKEIILAEEIDNDPQDANYLAGIGGPSAEGVIAQINPALLADGKWQIVIEAADVSGKVSSVSFDITIDSEIKLGNFNLSFTDMTVPVGGIPITIQRTYDSYRAHEMGDFGYGWFLDQLTGELEVAIRNEEESLISNIQQGNAYTHGTRLTITLPNGEKHGFTAVPQVIRTLSDNGTAGAIAGFANLYFIYFMPDAGQFSKLELSSGTRYAVTDDAGLTPRQKEEGVISTSLVLNENGQFVSAGTPYNPSIYGTDFVLKTRDGYTYRYDSSTGRLEYATDPSGNRISTTPTRVKTETSTGQETSVHIERDDLNRITKIIDPADNYIEYIYDPNTGDLVKVIDRTGLQTSLQYAETDWSESGVTVSHLEHILTSITNGVGVNVLKVGFYADGRLKQLEDATGAAADFSYDLDHPSLNAGETIESVSDGSQSATEVIRDDHGNAIRTLQQIESDLFLVSVFEYDENNNQTRSYQPFQTNGANKYTAIPTAILTQSAYDVYGYLTSTTDALGNTTTYSQYDDYGNPTRITDALGNATVYAYNDIGMLAKTIDAQGQETRYSYDDRGNLTKITQVTSDGSVVQPSSFVYNDLNQLTSTTDANGISQYFLYNLVGDQTLTWSHWADPQDANPDIENTLATRTDYDAEGRVVGTRYYVMRGEENFTAADDLDSFTPVWTTATTYDGVGRVASTTDRFGVTTNNRYDSRGNVVETRTLTKDENGTSVTLVTRSAYDANGRLVATSDPFIVDHTNNDALLTATADLRVTHTLYDNLGRTTETRRLAGVAITLAEPQTGVYAIVFNDSYPPAALLTYTENLYDSHGRVRTTIAYNDPDDANDNVRTDFYYDAAGRQIATLGPAFTDAQGRIIRTLSIPQYDILGRQEQTTTGIAILNTIANFATRPDYADLIDTQAGYHDDSLAQTTAFGFDAVGRVTHTTQIGDISTGNIQTRSIYDELGRVVAEIDALGRRTDYKYDDSGRLISVTLPQVQSTVPTLGLNEYTVTKYDPAQYHASGNTSISSDGSTITLTGNEWSKINFDYTITADTILEFDFRSDVQAEIHAIGFDTDNDANDYRKFQLHGTQTATYAEHDYNDYTPGEGWKHYRIRVGDFFTGAVNYLTFANDSDAAPYGGDGSFRNIRIYEESAATPGQRPTYTYSYDDYGNQTAVTDPQGNVTQFTYDAEGRQLTRTLPLGVQTTGDNTDFVETSIYFTSGIHYGLLQRAIDFEGHVTEYTYDDIGRVLSKSYADTVTGADTQTWSRTVSYTYDAFGRTVEVDDSGHGITTYSYDAEGRTTQIDSPEGTINYEFDALGRHTATDTGTTRTEYSYDSLGRLVEVTAVEREGTALTTPETTTYYYDVLGALDLTSQTGSGGDVLVDYVYDALGRVDQIIHFTDETGGNALVYDLGTDTLIASFDYEYDAAGNRIAAAEIVDGETYNWNWSYDGLNRLVTEQLDAGDNNLDYTTAYSYDLVGNRIAMAVDQNSDGSVDALKTYFYDANDRMLIEKLDDDNDGFVDQTTAYTYGPNSDLANGFGGDHTVQTQVTVRNGDAAVGSFTSRTSYAYDATGRMVSMQIDSDGDGTADTTTTYTYDDNGLRISETTGSETRTYLFDAMNPTGYAQVIEEFVNSILHHSYTLGHDVITQADTSATPGGSAAHHLLYDVHGSTRALLNAAAAITQQYTYTAYGTHLTSANLTGAANALTRLLYSGEWTTPTGQQYLRARWYNPNTGRFNRLDPYAGNYNDPLSLHKYAYGQGNPVMGIDPTGMFSLTEVNAANSIASLITQLEGQMGSAAQDAASAAVSGISMNQLLIANVNISAAIYGISAGLGIAIPLASLLFRKASGLLFENRAKFFVRNSLQEVVFDSKFFRGAVDRGVDFISIAGTGKNAKLIINEVKNVKGHVSPSSFTAFGLGNGGQRIWKENITHARSIIENSNLDLATKSTVLNQLENKHIIVRIIGNWDKRTTWAMDIVDQMRRSTGFDVLIDGTVIR